MKHALLVLFCITSCARGTEELSEAQQRAVRATMEALVGNVEHAINNQLIAESIKGGTLQVERLLRAGASIISCDEFGRTALHMALANDCFSVAQQLFTKNPPVNAQDDAGRTPLMAVVFLPNDPEKALKVCKELKRRGASFDLCDNDSRNALMLAADAHVYCRGPYRQLFEYLAHHTKNPNQQAKDGSTALDYAAAMGNAQGLKVLLDAGANATLEDKKGRISGDVARLHKQKVPDLLMQCDAE